MPTPSSLQVNSNYGDSNRTGDSNSGDSNCTVDNLTVLENKCQEVIRLPMMMEEAYNKIQDLISLGPKKYECDWLKKHNLCSESVLIAVKISTTNCICS